MQFPYCPQESTTTLIMTPSPSPSLRSPYVVRDPRGTLAAIGSPLVDRSIANHSGVLRYANGFRRPDAYWKLLSQVTDQPSAICYPGVCAQSGTLLYKLRAQGRPISPAADSQRTYYQRLHAKLSPASQKALVRLWSMFHKNGVWPTLEEFSGRISAEPDQAYSNISELSQNNFIDVASPNLKDVNRFIVPKTDPFGNPLTVDEMIEAWQIVTARWHAAVLKHTAVNVSDLDHDDKVILSTLLNDIRKRTSPTAFCQFTQLQDMHVRSRANIYKRLIKLYKAGFIDLVRDPNGTIQVFPILKYTADGKPLVADAILAQFGRLFKTETPTAPDTLAELYQESLLTKARKAGKHESLGSQGIQKYLLERMAARQMPPTMAELADGLHTSHSNAERLVNTLLAFGLVLTVLDPVTRSNKTYVIVVKKDEDLYLPSPDVSWQFAQITDKRLAIERLGATQRLVMEAIVRLGKNVSYKKLYPLFSGENGTSFIDQGKIRMACTQLRDMGFISIKPTGKALTVAISPLV